MSKYPYISDKKCLYCSGDITIKRSRDKNNIYCSTACVGKHLRTKVKEKSKCLNCGEKFDNRYGDKNIYCGRICQNEYKSKNKKIYERICKYCGKKFYPKQITYSRIQNIYCSSECSSRKYYLNQDYFQNINTEEKSYWLGFIYADGNVYKNTLTIKLHEKDKKHIELFKTKIESDHPIKDIETNKSFIQINSKKLAKQLNSLGVIPKKTFKIKLPKLREDLYNDFIRGYFDGDGCMYVNNKYHTFSMYSSSYSFRKSLKQIFLNKLDIKLNENGGSLSKSSKNDLIKIYNFLYDKKDLSYLNRKKEKFEIFLNNI